jgi:small subunit ribosomal protein S16
VAVKIRLKRMGKIRQPYYRVVVVDSRKKRDGRVIEEIGKYHPKEEPSFIEVTSERALYWLGVGAQPSEAVEALLKITGDWQKFKGLPGTEGSLRVAEVKRDKTEIFNEALKDAANEPKSGATTAKKTAKKAAPAPEDKPAIEPKAEKPAAEKPAAEAAPEVVADEAPAEAAADEAPAEAAAPEAPAEAAAPEAPAEAAADEPTADAPAADAPADEA